LSRNAKLVVRFLIVWVIGLAALAIFHFAVVLPGGRALGDCRRRVADKVERVTFLRNARSERRQQRIRMEREDRERQYREFVFDTNDLNRLDFLIRDLAEGHDLADFSGRTVGTATKIGGEELKRIAQRNVVLSFRCGFAQLVRFINELERHQPIIFVDQFTVRAAVGQEAGLDCDMECSILYRKAGD